MLGKDAVGIDARRGNGGVLHVDVDVANDWTEIVIGIDAVSIFTHRGNGGALHVDVDGGDPRVHPADMPAIDAITKPIRRLDGAALNADCDVVGAIRMAHDGARSGRDVDLVRRDVDVAGAPAKAVDRVDQAARRGDGGVLDVDVDVAGARVKAVDRVGPIAHRLDGGVLGRRC